MEIIDFKETFGTYKITDTDRTLPYRRLLKKKKKKKKKKEKGKEMFKHLKAKNLHGHGGC